MFNCCADAVTGATVVSRAAAMSVKIKCFISISFDLGAVVIRSQLLLAQNAKWRAQLPEDFFEAGI
jgi:hypothetical protein